MAQYIELNKIIKKGRKIEAPRTLLESLLKYFSSVFKEDISRELDFVSTYYGLTRPALTLEKIGYSQETKLTRERVRQIIDGTLKKTKPLLKDEVSPFILAEKEFANILGNSMFLRLSDLTKTDFFKDFKKNTKGLISFLNDCGIKQIAYRKQYYFYPSSVSRKLVVQSIQKENKVLRREKTISNMSKKSKTVTYVPNEVRDFLLAYSNKHKVHLNPLYENILNQFISEKPYLKPTFEFSKTKSWKARKGKALWQQVGIYIDKDVFDSVKDSVALIKKDMRKNVSLMSFICQSFVWFYNKNK
jgi:hypothetical protein